MRTSILLRFSVLSLFAATLQASEPVSYRRVLPGVIQAKGADGARNETSVWLVNLGTSPGSFELTFLPVSNESAPPAQVRTLGSGETLRWNQPLQDLFGLGEAEGALIVRGDQPFELRGVHRNVTSAAAGASVRSLVASELFGPNSSGHSIWLANRMDPDPEFRTEITAVLSAPDTAITVSVYDASGVLRGIEVVTSEKPAVWRRSASQFLPDPEIPVGRVKFAVTAGEATGYVFVTGGSVPTGLVGQAERIAPAPSTSNAVSRSYVLNGVTTATGLRIFNPNESEQEITIEPLGFPDVPALARRLTIAPNGLVEIPDVLGAGRPSRPEPAVGALRIQGTALPLLVSGRGLVPASLDENGFATANQPVTLVGLNGNASRIALLGGTRGAVGLLRLRDARGAAMASAPIRLEANEWQGKALGAWFGETEIPADARVDIELENGSAHGYAEVADDSTDGRVLVAPAVVPVATPALQSAKRLAFSMLPTSFTVAAPFTATIQALRADDSIDTAFTGSVDLRVATGPGALAAGTSSQMATAGVASFRDLRFTVPGSYSLTALGSGLEAAVSQPFEVAPAPAASPTVIRVGTFAGQNGYTAQGTLRVERAANGSETLRLNPDFRVSAGAGAISVWFARSSGPLVANSSLRVGTINRVFAGEFTFPIPSPGSSGFTHVIVYCDGFRVNFGAAQLQNP